MILYKKATDIQQKIKSLKKEGRTIGFVPTMGALHQGHLSLIEASHKENDVTVCSIFVNPAQFNDSNDFIKYPVTLEQDILQLTKAGTDLLFLPSVDEIYPEGKPTDHYALEDLETILEGEYRPGHFQGVCQVLQRLFRIVNPHKAYFGQKDYQQCSVVKKLVKLMQIPVGIVIHPTIREASGLAMSSRNMRLSEEDKDRATAIYKALSFIKENKMQLPIPALVEQAKQTLIEAHFDKIDYVEIKNADNLEPIDSIAETTPSIALVAAFINDVRLIDNMLL